MFGNAFVGECGSAEVHGHRRLRADGALADGSHRGVCSDCPNGWCQLGAAPRSELSNSMVGEAPACATAAPLFDAMFK